MRTQEDHQGYPSRPPNGVQQASLPSHGLTLDTRGALASFRQPQGPHHPTFRGIDPSPSSPLSPLSPPGPTLMTPSPSFSTEVHQPRSSGDFVHANRNGETAPSPSNTRRPSLPELLAKAGMSQPATAIKAAVIRNSPSPSSLFKSRKFARQNSHDYSVASLMDGANGDQAESTSEVGASTPSTSTSAATSRKLNAKKSITNLLRKAANGLNSPATIMNKMENRRRSSSSVSNVSNGSLEVTSATSANRSGPRRGSFSQQLPSTGAPPIPAFAHRKSSFPTANLLSRPQLRFDEDILNRQRRRAMSSASVLIPTGGAGSSASASPPLCSTSEVFNSLDHTIPPLRGLQRPDVPKVQSYGTEAGVRSPRLAVPVPDRPGSRGQRSHSNPPVSSRGMQSLPMACRSATMGTTVSSTSVEVQESLLLSYADQFASEGMAPAGVGGETITLAQQLIAVGEALAAERARSRSGSGTMGSERQGERGGDHDHDSCISNDSSRNNDGTTPQHHGLGTTMTTNRGDALTSNGSTLSPRSALASVCEGQSMMD